MRSSQFSACQHATDATKQFYKSAIDDSTHRIMAELSSKWHVCTEQHATDVTKQFYNSAIDDSTHRIILRAHGRAKQWMARMHRACCQLNDLPSAIFMRNDKKNVRVEFVCGEFCSYYVQYRPSAVTVNLVFTNALTVHLLAVHKITSSQVDAWLHGKAVTYWPHKFGILSRVYRSEGYVRPDLTHHRIWPLS
jgi:hypothetical protein